MPLRWRRRPRFDGMTAGERSLAGQFRSFVRDPMQTFGRLFRSTQQSFIKTHGRKLSCGIRFIAILRSPILNCDHRSAPRLDFAKSGV
jgi:hypothetical protein